MLLLYVLCPLFRLSGLMACGAYTYLWAAFGVLDRFANRVAILRQFFSWDHLTIHWWLPAVPRQRSNSTFQRGSSKKPAPAIPSYVLVVTGDMRHRVVEAATTEFSLPKNNRHGVLPTLAANCRRLLATEVTLCTSPHTAPRQLARNASSRTHRVWFNFLVRIAITHPGSRPNRCSPGA